MAPPAQDGNADATGQNDSMDANEDAQCNLRFLMVNGESFTLTGSVNSTVEDLKNKIIEDPPKELREFLESSTPGAPSVPKSVDELRILHLGKFLEDNKLLKDCFETGKDKQTTVHIAVRIATRGSEERNEKKPNKTSGCCAVM